MCVCVHVRVRVRARVCVFIKFRPSVIQNSVIENYKFDLVDYLGGGGGGGVL